MTQINARLSATGEAHITGSNGRTWNTTYADLTTARQSVQETAVATAAAIDAPVQLVVTDPTGEHRWLVFANGETEAAGGGSVPAPAHALATSVSRGSLRDAGRSGARIGGSDGGSDAMGVFSSGASSREASAADALAPDSLAADSLATGVPAAGVPAAGVPAAGVPAAGVPVAGAAVGAGHGVEPAALPEPPSRAPRAGEHVAPTAPEPVAPSSPPRPFVAPSSLIASEAAPEAPLRERRRRPTAADFAASRPVAPQSPAQEGWQGAVNSLSGGALRLAPGMQEVARREWRASAQRGLAGHKTVVFVNLKGGASKTTACYLTAATLGRVRGGNVLAWDNNENKGTLGDRAMAASHDHTAIDLLANVERFATPSNAHELVNYVRPQGENKFHVLASQNQAGDKEVIDGAAFVQLHSVLRQFYHLALVDTGNASTAGTWQAAVEIADEIVLVAMNKEDSTKTLAATVDTLVDMGFADKLSRGVLLVTQPPVPSKNRKTRIAANEERLSRIREHFGHYVRSIVVAPYDEALDDGADIIFENLAPATQEAYLEATAAIVDGL